MSEPNTNANNSVVGITKTIWQSNVVQTTRKEYISCLSEVSNQAKNVYDKLSNHLERLNLVRPTPLDNVLILFEEFDDINTTADRALLNLFIYINAIRCNHLSCNLPNSHNEAIVGLLQIITQQRQSIGATDYTSFLEAYNDQKDKSTELYYPCLALLEKKTIKTLLNALIGITMICNFVTKHLEDTDILDSVDISLKSNNHHTMYM